MQTPAIDKENEDNYQTKSFLLFIISSINKYIALLFLARILENKTFHEKICKKIIWPYLNIKYRSGPGGSMS